MAALAFVYATYRFTVPGVPARGSHTRVKSLLGTNFSLHSLERAGVTNASLRRAARMLGPHLPRAKYCMGATPNESSHETSCYGEITADGMASLVREMPSQCALTPQSVFLDFGSGDGRLPFFVRVATDVREAVGVEIVRCRHERALKLRRSLPSHGRRGRSGLTYLHRDVRRTGLPNATHLFMHSTCFSAPLVKDILRLATEAGVSCVIDYGRLVVDNTVQDWGPVVHAITAPASWLAGMVALVHRRKGGEGTEVSRRSYDVGNRLANFQLDPL